jgi:hypothetical protein
MVSEAPPAPAPAEQAPPSPPPEPNAAVLPAGTDAAFLTGNGADPEQAPSGEPPAQEAAPADAATPPPKTLAELTDEELANDERVQKLVESRSSETRQRAIDEAQANEARQRREYMASEQFVRDFEGEIRRASAQVDDAGNVTIDQDKVDGMFRNLLWTGAEEAVSGIGRLLGEQAGNVELSADEQEARRLALAEYNRDPIKGAGTLLRHWLGIRDRVVLEGDRSKIRQEVERELRREYEARDEERQRIAARDETRNQGGPTPLSGAPAGAAWRSQREIDNAHAQDRISTDEYSRLLGDGTYYRLPR